MSRAPVAGMWSASPRLVPDSRLTRLAVRGDARAFEAIFRRHHQELYRYCRAILSDPDDAQDALQGTMAAALRALPGESRDIELRPWLFRVAHNEAITIARRRRESPPAHDPAPTAPGADVDAAERERLRTLVEDLNSLPERQRGALVMRELSGLSYGDIGAALATSEATARQTVYEAREAMREAGLARDADCAGIRELISARDGRVLRGRKVRAHVRACAGCNDYLEGISQRRSDLQMLAPPLPAAAAGALFAALAGEGGRAGLVAGLGASGSAGGAGGVLGAGGALAGGSAVTKGGAVLAAIALGAGASSVTGAVDLPFNDSGGSASTPAAEEASPRATERREARGGAEAGQGASAGRGNAEANAPGAEARAAGRDNGRRGTEREGTGPPGVDVPEAVTPPPEQAVGTGVPESAGTGAGNAGGSSSAASSRSASSPPPDAATTNSNAGAGGPPDKASGQGKPSL